MELKEQKIKIRKYIIIGILSILIILFITALFKMASKDKIKSSNFIKQGASYTIPGSKISSYLPIVAIKSSDTNAVNKEIEEDYNETIKSNNSSFNYQYSISNNYFSLVTIKIAIDKDTNYTYPVFKTYNFSLNNNKLVNDSELLNSFNKTSFDVSNSLEKKLKEYYKGELTNKYLSDEECDYECFLKLRKVDSYDEDNYLYVENNQLKFFHSFMIFSKTGEEEFYKDENFLYNVE